MDVATIANFLLFLGAFGASLALDDSGSSSSAGRDDGDDLYDRADYARTDRLGDDDDEVTADADNIAWFTGGGDDSLTASSGDDYANLGDGDDQAAMGAGNDKLEAGDGDDSAEGGNGNDILLAGTGADTLTGDLGDDSLAGEAGDDALAGGAGRDILSGGAGNDVLSGFDPDAGATASMTGADGADQLFGGEGDDRLLLGRGDLATGGAGRDVFQMDNRWGESTERFVITDYTAGQDQLELHYSPQLDPDTSRPVTPTLTVQTSEDGSSSLILLGGTVVAVVQGVPDLSADAVELVADTQTDTVFNPDSFDNAHTGSAADDTVAGGAGSDYARLGDGDDSMAAGTGNDAARGDAGADTLSGEAGNDSLAGGDGDDAVDGGSGNDALTGDRGDDALAGGDGVDILLGGAGDDTLSGFDTEGPGGTASATDGADSLAGGDGDDTLYLGRGDLGDGGDGADTFALDARDNGDASSITTISDYDRGTDRIELHYTPALDGNGNPIAPTVTVLMGPGNAYAVITLNSEPVAHVTGATTLTLADIVLVAEA